jgi:hypothetical protein
MRNPKKEHVIISIVPYGIKFFTYSQTKRNLSWDLLLSINNDYKNSLFALTCPE